MHSVSHNICKCNVRYWKKQTWVMVDGQGENWIDEWLPFCYSHFLEVVLAQGASWARFGFVINMSQLIVFLPCSLLWTHIKSLFPQHLAGKKTPQAYKTQIGRIILFSSFWFWLLPSSFARGFQGVGELEICTLGNVFLFILVRTLPHAVTA